ncbi:MAG: DUF4276 family protein [Planctomycetaceae bacterium]|nr:DUF4276 family protein [Planctomycetaceae bacterium]
MSRIRIAAIVEGHGEVAAAPILLRRVWSEIAAAQYAEVLKPIRVKRKAVDQQDELRKAVGLAIAKLKNDPAAIDPAVVLLLIDRDPSPDPPCSLGPRLLGWMRADFGHADVSCVVANIEYETWFVAAADSLGKYLRMQSGEVAPLDPESQRSGKRWVSDRFRGAKYSETQDQPAMTATMDLNLCRGRSPSFDKFCRELERRTGVVP